MANLTRLLGTMLASGMAGRSRRGPAFAAAPLGMAGVSRGGGFRQTAGLAALGYLAYKAYNDYQGRDGGPAQQPGRDDGRMAAGQPQAREGGQSLGDRLAGLLRPEQRQAPEAAVGDRKALLLIRAMVSAANADGRIDPDERQRILGRIDEAGAGPDDHRFLEQELASPKPIDALLVEVGDEETAEQVYLASLLAMQPDSAAERSYLQYLAARLNLTDAQVRDLHQSAGI